MLPIALAGVPPIVLNALRRLRDGATEEELATEAGDSGDGWAVATFLFHLRRLEAMKLLAYRVRGAGGELAALHPVSPWFELNRVELDPGQRYVLSRFALQRRLGASMVLESPRSHAMVRLLDSRAAAFCLALATPSTTKELAAAVPSVAPDEGATLLGILLAAGLVLAADIEGQTEEEKAPHLWPWTFHDLLFHARSRPGRHARPVGKTYPFYNRLPPLPAVRPLHEGSGEPIPLARPDIEKLIASDVPFTAVLEARRSVRVQGSEPITLEVLGEFLYRSARVRTLTPMTAATGYDMSNRPYPSGGASYDVEIYVAVERCRGLEPGLYHYDPEGHRLFRRCGRTPEVEALLMDAAYSTMSPALPQLLICLASRFQRLAWAYEGMAYATTLKNVGVLYQTFYLVATAMGLSCCGVGRGNSDLFAKAAGTEYCAETTVGEFLLGSREHG